jgi:hypothetical protein
MTNPTAHRSGGQVQALAGGLSPAGTMPAQPCKEAPVLKQVVPFHDAGRPLHETGEVVLVTLGNFIEAGDRYSPKDRPAIIVAAGPGQHVTAGLTTRSHCRTTGAARVEIPTVVELGLDPARRSYLWGPRPSHICRLDVRRHLGWVDLDTVELLSKAMHLPRWMLVGLIRAAATADRATSKPR